jgi:hypothetical protein
VIEQLSKPIKMNYVISHCYLLDLNLVGTVLHSSIIVGSIIFIILLCTFIGLGAKYQMHGNAQYEQTNAKKKFIITIMFIVGIKSTAKKCIAA